eukprot:comp4888_c0_seq1/m.993 comp4888_c0_seq1/g.993  ORF comp4888_c0_seq1/g.993 comp4888_c0_seq1/m.993 type:complete len:808 (-) comp4888_c0_seq1:32-2455(-)
MAANARQHLTLTNFFALLGFLALSLCAFFFHVWWGLRCYQPQRLGVYAQWSIGLAHGDSPTTLSFSEKLSVGNIDAWDLPADFLADPFVIQTPKGALVKNPDLHPYYLFFESKYVYYHGGNGRSAPLKPSLLGNGVISVAWGDSMTPDANGRLWRYEKQVLVEDPYHLSYPFVFEHKGEVWMIPEIGDVKQVRLYRAHNFPYDWRVEKVLLEGAPFRDTSPILKDGRWWLFTHVSGTDEFHIYYSDTDDIVTAKWTLHPRTPMYVGDLKYSRPGGRPVIHNGHIYRFVQDSSNRYGEKVRIMRVDALTTTEFSEVDVGVYGPEDDKPWKSRRTHHVDVHVGTDGKWYGVADGNDHYYSEHLMFYLGIVAIYLFYGTSLCGLWWVRVRVMQQYTTSGTPMQILNGWVRERLAAVRKGVNTLPNHIGPRKTLLLVPLVLCVSLVLWRTTMSGGVPFEGELMLHQIVKTVHDANGSLVFRSNFEPGECPVTVVMAFYDAGMTDQKTEKPRDLNSFLNWVGINMESINSCIVMYTESPFLEHLIGRRGCTVGEKTGDGQYRLKGCKWPIEFNSVPLDRLRQHKMFPLIQEAIRVFDPTYVRPTRVERIVAEYNLIQFHKTVLVAETSRKNPFGSEFFFWADAAYGKGWWVQWSSYARYRWPDIDKVRAMVDTKRLFITTDHRPGGRQWDCSPNTTEIRAKSHPANIAGGFFGGTKEAIERYYAAWDVVMIDLLKRKIMDDDQFVQQQMLCEHPDLIQVYGGPHLCARAEVVCVGTQRLLRWFFGIPRIGICLSRSHAPLWTFHKDFWPFWA